MLPPPAGPFRTAKSPLAVAAVGIEEGPSHTELQLVGGTEPHVLEIGARIGGSGVSQVIVHASTGIELAEVVIRQALGHALDISRWTCSDGSRLGPRATASNWIIPLQGYGIFQGFSGLDTVREHPETRLVVEFLRSGDEVPEWPRWSTYPGFVFSCHPSYQAGLDYYRFLSDTVSIQWQCW